MSHEQFIPSGPETPPCLLRVLAGQYGPVALAIQRRVTKAIIIQVEEIRHVTTPFASLTIQEFEYTTTHPDCHSERSEESLVTYMQLCSLPEPDNCILARSDYRTIGCPRKGLNVNILLAGIADGGRLRIPDLHGSLVAACREVPAIRRPIGAIRLSSRYFCELPHTFSTKACSARQPGKSVR